MTDTPEKPKPHRAYPLLPADFDIGYGKPPVETRFKPGKSGNPKGRPKNGPSLAKSLGNVLYGKITIRENGEMKEIIALDGIFKAMRFKALKGDTRAAALLLHMAEIHKVQQRLEPRNEIHVRFVSPDPAFIAELERDGKEDK
ncbi:DUF5681 domain-containing protein [Aestuariivirga litoralis]|uniref:DUF5681 domain-containing protein n=1 Tax=Aestuariivirga litoralis TaxID=2650924 RepID=UPI0018C55578|nr:DUF5681 domain-containing protein [Aestuariivirga litoralis]MBG1233488.1 hypothetical protein [Aestuariivirga litoralis]